jgi:hypothetical protein
MSCPTCHRSHRGWHTPPPHVQAASIAKNKAQAQERAAALLEDIEWLLESGEPPQAIAARLGYAKPASLARRLSRHGRADLAAIYWRVARRELVS